METKLKQWLNSAPHGYAKSLAQLANISPQTLYKIAANKGNLSINIANDLCRGVRQLNHERARRDGTEMLKITMEDFINERT